MLQKVTALTDQAAPITNQPQRFSHSNPSHGPDMTAEIINLRTARKRQAREQKEHTAAENRVRFGRSRADKARTSAEKALADKRLDGLRRDDPDGGGDAPQDDKKR